MTRCPICKTLMVTDAPFEATFTIDGEPQAGPVLPVLTDLRCPTCGYHTSTAYTGLSPEELGRKEREQP